MSETLPIGDLLNLTKLGRLDLPTREVASSSPGALSMSMSVAEEVGLERHMNWLVRTRKSLAELRKTNEILTPKQWGRPS